MARDCRTSAGRVSISCRSWAVVAADSSVESFSRTDGVIGLSDRIWVWRAGAGTRLGLGGRPLSAAWLCFGVQFYLNLLRIDGHL